jgi:leucyl aminopeptidase
MVKVTMAHKLPPEPNIEIRCRQYTATESSLARADAAIFILEKSRCSELLATLPHPGLWRALYRAAVEASASPILTARLPNSRHTLVTVGFSAPLTSAFERLELAGKLAREVAQPGASILRQHAIGFDDAAALDWQEAIASAVLARAAPMPQRKSRPDPGSALRRLEIGAPDSFPVVEVQAVASGNYLARWLATMPPNELDCLAYRESLQSLAAQEGWQFRFYDEPSLERLGAGAFLAVSRANAHRGAGIVRLSYRPKKSRRAPKLALVGKGICFDTGGINLKPHKSMYRMHGDMQGSSVAVGTMLALSRTSAPYSIDCWLALTENEIGPLAYRPQEVVTASNGVTIQVVHSDAEGRMVLADTLALASGSKPSFILDFATLTGTCVTALTERYSGAFTNRPALQDRLQDTGRSSGERVWCFPMDEDFDRELDSPIADILQCTVNGNGDHILAARFLNRFVPAEIPWVHVDLSAAERKGGLANIPSDMTGFGVRFAHRLLADGKLLDELQEPS